MPDQNCKICEHKINHNTDGHCYMFKNKVEGCGQFKSIIEKHIKLFKEAWHNFLIDDSNSNWQKQDKLTQVLFAHKMTPDDIDKIMTEIQKEVDNT